MGNSDGIGIHIFISFFGGPDDHLALDLVVKICAIPRVVSGGTVVRMMKRDKVAVGTGKEAQAHQENMEKT